MTVLRIAVVVVTATVAAVLVYFLSIVPYQQNLMKRHLEDQFDALDSAAGLSTPSVTKAARVRDNIEELRRALKVSPTDADLYMELAAEYRFLGKYDQAVITYQQALRYHRRPELYINIAESRYDLRDLAGAVESYAYAVAFAPEEINVVPDALIPAVDARAREITARIAR